MKISYIQGYDIRSTETRISFNLKDKLTERGIQIMFNECDKHCDYILSINGLGINDTIVNIHNRYPDKKLIIYVWDMYPWTDYARGYDILKKCHQIWTPSYEVILRLKELYNIPEGKCRVIPTYVEFFEADEKNVFNGNFVYHPVRLYEDKHLYWTDIACTTLNIPLLRSNHTLTKEEYRKKVLTCSFMVTEYFESSTGGLTLLEGYYHGKNILISDSIYQGARDYFGDKATYFKSENYTDFLIKMAVMWRNANNPVNIQCRREYCKNFTIDCMVDNIVNNLTNG